MATRKKKPSKVALIGRKASVAVERNGACISMSDVPAEQAGTVLGDLLKAFRLLSRDYPELIQQLDAIGGGSTTFVPDEYADDEGKAREKRVGF